MQLMTEREVIQELNVSRATVRRMWADGTIPKPIRIGRRGIRWRRADIESFINNKPGLPAAQKAS